MTDRLTALLFLHQVQQGSLKALSSTASQQLQGTYSLSRYYGALSPSQPHHSPSLKTVWDLLSMEQLK